jgi:hypothetical protein
MPFFVKKLTQVDTSSPDAVGKSLVNLAKYTEDEFFQVSAALQDTYADHIWNKPPPKPRRGTTAYADGTNWNPGSGEGPYFFDGTATWRPMAATTGWWAAGDAPSTGKYYGRQNGTWQIVTPEAPNDGNLYARQSLGWTSVVQPVAAAPVRTILGADIAVNNTANYFDGPNIALGTGTWWVLGVTTVYDNTNAVSWKFKLWDGTNVYASGFSWTTAGGYVTTTLGTYVTGPVASIRVAVNDPNGTTGFIKFNFSGNSKDTMISAYRIA